MCEICTNNTPHTHLTVNVYKYDPTRTTTLRNLFARESNRRFDEFAKNVHDLISSTSLDAISVFQTPEERFPLRSDIRRINNFTVWLERQLNSGILKDWPNKYLSDAYKRGIIRSLTEMRKAGYNIPNLTELGGVDFLLTSSHHINTLELIYLRSFQELKGITASMQQIMVRVLTQGFIEGKSYTVIADELFAAINGAGLGDLGMFDKLGRFIPARRRAELLARTEIVRAHHLAMMQEYKKWGVPGVTILAEFRTAGDERVCAQCSSMEGNVYTLEAAEGLVPVHPLCRCIVLPLTRIKR